MERVKALLGPQLAGARGQVIVAGNARLVRVPEETLREVLLNLCESAIKYRSDQDPRIVVELDQKSQLISVIDNGRGMATEQRARVFDRGFQTDDANPGHGFGMARVQELVAELGGTIEVGVSAPGGSVFAIHLPGRIGAG